uniref:Uncharacterized protein n=1 Tax=Octopus bimaculoides TaxID=37653 RepID=A0A0L8G4Z3_OCTBM
MAAITMDLDEKISILQTTITSTQNWLGQGLEMIIQADPVIWKISSTPLWRVIRD